MNRQQFIEDGFVSIPAFLSPDEIAEVNANIDRFIATTLPTLPRELVYYDDPNDAATLKQIQMLHEHDSFFAGLMFDSPFERFAEVLLDEAVIGKNMQFFDKPAGSGRPTPPHQDGFYFMLAPSHALTMWLALEDVGIDQGCVRYVRGSHERGMRSHGDSDVLGFSQHILDFGTSADRDNDVRCPCEAGHLFAHHSLTIHHASANTAPGKTRRALGLIYYGESARVDEEAHARYQRRLAERLATEGRI